MPFSRNPQSSAPGVKAIAAGHAGPLTRPTLAFSQLLIAGLPMFPKRQFTTNVFGGPFGSSESRALRRWECGLSGQRNRSVHQSRNEEKVLHGGAPIGASSPKLRQLGPKSPICRWPLHSVEKSPSGESRYELYCSEQQPQLSGS